MRIFRGLLLSLCAMVVLAGLATATTTSTTLDTDNATLVWTVSGGTIDGFPGISPTDTFSCTGTGSCSTTIGGLSMTFTGDASSKGKITFGAKNVCGTGSCTALVAANDTATVSPSATLGTCTYSLTYNFIAYLPTSCKCFGGSPPAFRVRATASATGAC